MDNQINSQKALDKYNSNKVKLDNKSNKKIIVASNLKAIMKDNIISSVNDNSISSVNDNSISSSVNNNIISSNVNDNNTNSGNTNEYLLNGMCRVCKLADRTCRCLRFSKDAKELICYCGNKECEFDCGVLVCGCIDICRKHRDYGDYF